jgi:hypothetical protein
LDTAPVVADRLGCRQAVGQHRGALYRLEMGDERTVVEGTLLGLDARMHDCAAVVHLVGDHHRHEPLGSLRYLADSPPPSPTSTNGTHMADARILLSLAESGRP